MIGRKVFLILLLIAVAFAGCDEDSETCIQPENKPGSIFIAYPLNNSTVYEIAKITCVVADNDGVKKVNLWVGGYQVPEAEDSSEPYELYWNTLGYDDRSSHMIIARVYDNSNQITDSEPIILIVDNSYSYPSQVNIRSIEFQDNSFVITWLPSGDGDFYRYDLYESLTRSMSGKTEIYSSTNINDTVHVVENIADGEKRYYQLSVVDTVGLVTPSKVFRGSSSDLVAYYPFNGNANDEGGDEMHGRVDGADLTEDRNSNPNSAYYFDGEWDRIDLRDYPELCIAGDLTISLWMKVTSFDRGVPALVNCQTRDISDSPETNALYSLQFYENDNSIVYYHEYGSGNDNFHEFSEYNFDVDVWYHIAVVRDADSRTVDLYINGVFIAADNYPENPSSGNLAGLSFGENQGTIRSDRFFNGVLDEIYIYKRALSSTEIEDLYNQ